MKWFSCVILQPLFSNKLVGVWIDDESYLCQTDVVARASKALSFFAVDSHKSKAIKVEPQHPYLPGLEICFRATHSIFGRYINAVAISLNRNINGIPGYMKEWDVLRTQLLVREPMLGIFSTSTAQQFSRDSKYWIVLPSEILFWS